MQAALHAVKAVLFLAGYATRQFLCDLAVVSHVSPGANVLSGPTS